MIGAGQLAAALYGLRLLLGLDPRGLMLFDKTPGGFARSFLVAGVLVPLNATHWVLTYNPAKAHLAMMPYLVVQGLTYVLLWVAFPFVMLYVTELLNRQTRYFWHIVPYNWMQLPIGLVLLPLALIADLHLFPGRLTVFLNLMALAMFFTYATFIARWGLQVGLFGAFGVVIIDLLLNLVTNQLVSRI